MNHLDYERTDHNSYERRPHEEQATHIRTSHHKTRRGPSKDAHGSLVRLWKLSQGEVSVVLCSSARRRAKESGITTQAEGRFLADVARLENSIAKGSIQRTQLVSERIGRIKAKYPKIATRYDFI